MRKFRKQQDRTVELGEALLAAVETVRTTSKDAYQMAALCNEKIDAVGEIAAKHYSEEMAMYAEQEKMAYAQRAREKARLGEIAELNSELRDTSELVRRSLAGASALTVGHPDKGLMKQLAYLSKKIDSMSKRAAKSEVIVFVVLFVFSDLRKISSFFVVVFLQNYPYPLTFFRAPSSVEPLVCIYHTPAARFRRSWIY